MSLPVSSGPQQPNPVTGITAADAAIPALAPNGPNAVPVHATLVAVAPTMSGKVSSAVDLDDSQRAHGLPPSHAPASVQQPSAQLPGSEPRLVDLAHPMDNLVAGSEPRVQGAARFASDSDGKAVRMDLSEHKLTQKDFQWLARRLSSAQCKLEVLCLRDCTICDEAAKELAHAIRGNDSLKIFSLRAASLMPTGWTYLTTALAAGWPCIGAPMEGRRFETLVLESARPGEVPLHLLRCILRDNRQLRELVISSSAMCEGAPTVPEEDWNEEFFQFCEALKKNQSLIVLDLSCYRFTAASLDKLILALDAHPAIETFHLGENILTREQSDSITAILARNAQANHARHDAPAAAALDLLVPASGGFAAGGIWPHELSDEIAGAMDWRTLLEMRQGLDAGFPGPAGTPASALEQPGAPASMASASFAMGDATGAPDDSPLPE